MQPGFRGKTRHSAFGANAVILVSFRINFYRVSTKKPLQDWKGFFFVAGTGLEPVTSGL